MTSTVTDIRHHRSITERMLTCSRLLNTVSIDGMYEVWLPGGVSDTVHLTRHDAGQCHFMFEGSIDELEAWVDERCAE